MGEGWIVDVWCPDCCGEDYQGCFEGGSELLTDDILTGKPRVFATREEAEAAGDAEVRNTIWKFDVKPAALPPPSPPAPPEERKEQK